MSNQSPKLNTQIDASKYNDRLKYVLITPARNEAAFIEQTIKSVIRQTILPNMWVIVSDGSTDGTDDIVKKYVAEYKWIELLQMPNRLERHFAAKVNAFNAGYARLRDIKFDIIGNLDADISFGRDNFEFLLARFVEDPLLGIAGTAYTEDSQPKYDYNISSIEDVSGQCQFFRRECFKDIGGYIPVKDGGIDSIPVYIARMKGWKTRTFTERYHVHHRRVGGAMGTRAQSFFRTGKKDYNSGGHLLWEVFRSFYQMRHKPYVIGGLSLLAGYLWLFLRNVDRPVSTELVAFRRREQLLRLKVFLINSIHPRGARHL